MDKPASELSNTVLAARLRSYVSDYKPLSYISKHLRPEDRATIREAAERLARSDSPEALESLRNELDWLMRCTTKDEAWDTINSEGFRAAAYRALTQERP